MVVREPGEVGDWRGPPGPSGETVGATAIENACQGATTRRPAPPRRCGAAIAPAYCLTRAPLSNQGRSIENGDAQTEGCTHLGPHADTARSPGATNKRIVPRHRDCSRRGGGEQEAGGWPPKSPTAVGDFNLGGWERAAGYRPGVCRKRLARHCLEVPHRSGGFRGPPTSAAPSAPRRRGGCSSRCAAGTRRTFRRWWRCSGSRRS
jgi:hypothetical protein